MSKVIFITGARKGIGRFLAEHFLSQGHSVIGCSRRDSDLEHKSYNHYLVDVSDEKNVVKITRRIVKEHGSIDVLLNNAGIAAMNAFLLTPGTTAERVFGTNTLGTFFMMREVSKTMIKKRQGRIVNFSTVAVPLRLEGEAVYAASKAAVESLTQIGARELAPYSITVNAIGPTPIATDLIKLIHKNKINALIERQAIQRLGTFEDVLNVVEFLIDDRSSFVTGQTLYLGGVNG
tara:strand:+ start:9003 stop:9704 length:702 start_codon:yes stop_codon:yes gene_type:complete